MVNRERKHVQNSVTSLCLEYLTLDGVLKNIQNLIEMYGGDATISKHTEEYGESEYYYVMVKEPESDNAMAKRIAQEEKWEAQATDREKRDYEILKAKYGKNN